jgi:hypothetical protein
MKTSQRTSNRASGHENESTGMKARRERCEIQTSVNTSKASANASKTSADRGERVRMSENKCMGKNECELGKEQLE